MKDRNASDMTDLRVEGREERKANDLHLSLKPEREEHCLAFGMRGRKQINDLQTYSWHSVYVASFI